jgi:arylsulfatase A-like enzyme
LLPWQVQLPRAISHGGRAADGARFPEQRLRSLAIGTALNFMARQKSNSSPFLAVIWYGSPHNPQRALEEDRQGFADGKLADHFGEIVGIDRSIGVLRKGLRELGIERDTLVWYCSDNGG